MLRPSDGKKTVKYIAANVFEIRTRPQILPNLSILYRRRVLEAEMSNFDAKRAERKAKIQSEPLQPLQVELASVERVRVTVP